MFSYHDFFVFQWIWHTKIIRKHDQDHDVDHYRDHDHDHDLDHDTFLLNGALYTCSIPKLSGKL